MQVYDGRIYLGTGNSSNVGPAPNAGPVPVMSWDPAIGEFREEFSVDDEQIDRYVVLDGTLYLPGHDARQNWKFGNIYRLRPGEPWQKLRTIPVALHVYDLMWHDNALIAAISTVRAWQGRQYAQTALARSADDGLNWQVVKSGEIRMYALLPVGNTLYAADLFAGPKLTTFLAESGSLESYAPIYQVPADGSLLRRPDLDASVMFPGQTFNGQRQNAKIIRTTAFGERAVYIGAYPHNDHQYWPFGVFVASPAASGGLHITRVPLPGHVRPWDVLVRGARVYILGNSRTAEGWLAQVFVTTDCTTVTDILKVPIPTFARSFEILNNDVYLGLGYEIRQPKHWNQKELHPLTGEILRVPLK